MGGLFFALVFRCWSGIFPLLKDMGRDADRGGVPGSGFPTPPCGLIFIRMAGVLGGSAKSPGREFLMDYEKDKTGNFERGYS